MCASNLLVMMQILQVLEWLQYRCTVPSILLFYMPHKNNKTMKLVKSQRTLANKTLMKLTKIYSCFIEDTLKLVEKF